MSSGENKCKGCGQWAGRGHKCPTPPPAVQSHREAPTATLTKEAPVDVSDRVSRARAAVSAIEEKEMAVKIDERLYELYEAEFHHQQYREWARESIRRAAGQRKDRSGNWDGSWEDALKAVQEGPDYNKRPLRDYEHHTTQLRQIALEKAEANAVYGEKPWTRAFLVINANGHVHKDMNCSTCFPTTRYEWLTAYSGSTENEVVSDAGETACTVCYPSAPAEVLNRPANLVSRSRAEKEAAKAERDAAKAEREAKRIAKAVTKDGSPLVVPSDDWYEHHSHSDRPAKLTTEVTATALWTDIEVGKTDTGWSLRPGPKQLETQRLIAQALADKHGRTYDEQVEVLMGKAAAKKKRQEREAAKYRR